MEPLTWTGSVGNILDPIFGVGLIAFLTLVLARVAAPATDVMPVSGSGAVAIATGGKPEINWVSFAISSVALMIALGIITIALVRGTYTGLAAGTGHLVAWVILLAVAAGLIFVAAQMAESLHASLLKAATALVVVCIAIYMFGGVFLPLGALGIVGEVCYQLTPVWVAMIVVFVASIAFKRNLGLYGKMFDSPVGMIGFGIVLFWVFCALFSGFFDLITTHDPLTQVSGMKNKLPGTPMNGAGEGDYPWYLLGGDNLARDVFSRVIYGSTVVISIAPLATFFGYIVGITLGLPAGYYGGRLDTILSFVANLILAFPVILLFYLLVTPEIIQTGMPNYMAAVFFIFPLVFVGVLLNSRYHIRPHIRTPLLIIVLGLGFWVYASTVSESGRGTLVDIWPNALDLFNVPSGILTVFIAVVFINSPTIFRIMRGLTLDVKSRDYVAAAQTRGETPWYIMLWEILPNVRGPLIVDFCLRIGYATILLGTLGFFGLGLPPESPDWGSTINEGRKLLSVYLHPALVPALSLLSLVLGLNLMADGLREQSLRD